MRPTKDRGARHERGGEFARVGRVVNHRPVDHRLLLGFASPFDKADGDGAVRSGADRIDDARIGDRRRVAVALQRELVVVDAARDVGRQDQGDIDGLRRARRTGRGTDRRQTKCDDGRRSGRTNSHDTHCRLLRGGASGTPR